MKYILTAVLWNPYQSKRPRGFYNIIKGHTGVDLNFVFEALPSPVTGEIVKVLKQSEMGNTIYLKDQEQGHIHVFSHMSKINYKAGDKVKRNDILGTTGNTGGKTTAPHLHYEVISLSKPAKILDRIMTRSLGGYNGWNIDPIRYIREIYGKYGLDSKGNPLKK